MFPSGGEKPSIAALRKSRSVVSPRRAPYTKPFNHTRTPFWLCLFFLPPPRLGLRVCSSKKPLHNCKTIDVLVQHTRPNETFLWEHSRYMHLIFYFSTIIIISHDQLMIAAGHLPTPPHSPDVTDGWNGGKDRAKERHPVEAYWHSAPPAHSTWTGGLQLGRS